MSVGLFCGSVGLFFFRLDSREEHRLSYLALISVCRALLRLYRSLLQTRGRSIVSIIWLSSVFVGYVGLFQVFAGIFQVFEGLFSVFVEFFSVFVGLF